MRLPRDLNQGKRIKIQQKASPQPSPKGEGADH
jgi:hypothetical protein